MLRVWQPAVASLPVICDASCPELRLSTNIPPGCVRKRSSALSRTVAVVEINIFDIDASARGQSRSIREVAIVQGAKIACASPSWSCAWGNMQNGSPRHLG